MHVRFSTSNRWFRIEEGKNLIEIVPVPEARTILSLASTGDGVLYGITDNEKVFAIDPKEDRITLLATPPVRITSGMAIGGRKIYFGSGANLWEFEIPLTPTVKQAE